MDTATDALTSKDPRTKAKGIIQMGASLRRVRRITSSDEVGVVLNSLYLGLFSAFDAFSGNLLVALFEERPDLYASINRDVPFKEILAAQDPAELRRAVLRDEIETFRRKSYTEQFTDLKNRFGIELTKYENWRKFVEHSQRRNLITHCDGIVSPQYIEECRAVGVPPDELPKVGETVAISPAYFREACDVLIETGAKLGQTLWRKVLPQQIEQADRHLTELIYTSLLDENWPRARMFSRFAVELRTHACELNRRIFLINYAQALKWAGDEESARKVLALDDWTVSRPDFRLACAVLLDNFDEAAALMRAIDKDSLIKDYSWYEWPLFRVFRSRPEFLEAFQVIYGYAFEEKAEEKAMAQVDEARRIVEHEGGAVDPRATPVASEDASTRNEAGPPPGE